MLYASTSLSLACLEILVHLGPDQIPPDYVYSSAQLIGPVETADFHGDLADEDATQRFGHSWAMSRQSLTLLVLSIVIPVEFNVLLNPVHPSYSDVIWSDPEPFQFDPRLLRRTAA
jgi:RES domain-containing protein